MGVPAQGFEIWIGPRGVDSLWRSADFDRAEVPAARPDWVRSTRSSRSIAATAPMIVKISRPDGVQVSIAQVEDLQANLVFVEVIEEAAEVAEVAGIAAETGQLDDDQRVSGTKVAEAGIPLRAVCAPLA